MIKEGRATMPCNTNGGLVCMYMSCGGAINQQVNFDPKIVAG